MHTDLEQDVNGRLTWDGGRVAMRNETCTQITYVPPLSVISNETSITLESFFQT